MRPRGSSFTALGDMRPVLEQLFERTLHQLVPQTVSGRALVAAGIDAFPEVALRGPLLVVGDGELREPVLLARGDEPLTDEGRFAFGAVVAAFLVHLDDDFSERLVDWERDHVPVLIDHAQRLLSPSASRWEIATAISICRVAIRSNRSLWRHLESTFETGAARTELLTLALSREEPDDSWFEEKEPRFDVTTVGGFAAALQLQDEVIVEALRRVWPAWAERCRLFLGATAPP